MLDLIYTSDPSLLVRFFIIILNMVPSFHFCNAFMNILVVTASSFDRNTSLWVKGSTYPYGKFFENIIKKSGGTEYSRPSPALSLLYMALLGVLYLCLMWIFDCLVASNRGFRSNPFSFLWSWFFKMRKTSADNREKKRRLTLASANDEEDIEYQTFEE